jgi:hypothetical protein
LAFPRSPTGWCRDGLVDLVLLGRPALSNAHWPVWAARELAHPDPISLLPEDWAWWLRNWPGPEGVMGWPPAKRPEDQELRDLAPGGTREPRRIVAGRVDRRVSRR